MKSKTEDKFKDKPTIIEVENIQKRFPIKRGVFMQTVGYVNALQSISFIVRENETVGIVGESGCGKTTISKILAQIHTPTSGSIHYTNATGVRVNLPKADKENRREYTKSVQMIFQDPYDSLNPRMIVRDIIAEPVTTWKIYKNKQEVDDLVASLLVSVGLQPDSAGRYPHEFSGGQRQRIAIARSISIKPRMIICDEPTSALDVSVQNQTLNLLKKLQDENNIAYLFITHNLDVARYMSDRVIIMYLGAVMEEIESENLFDSILHPYSKALIDSVPRLYSEQEIQKERIIIKGEPPSPIDIKAGCPFVNRCEHAMDICKKDFPKTVEISKNHKVACHLFVK